MQTNSLIAIVQQFAPPTQEKFCDGNILLWWRVSLCHTSFTGCYQKCNAIQYFVILSSRYLLNNDCSQLIDHQCTIRLPGATFYLWTKDCVRWYVRHVAFILLQSSLHLVFWTKHSFVAALSWHPALLKTHLTMRSVPVPELVPTWTPIKIIA